jgi:DNA sulfur modification protein DndD
MKIERVILTNFRQYFGQQCVQFTQDKERNVTVFHGVNGAGKTSFFTAINWCLYGEGADNIGQIISKEAVRRAQTDEEVISKVVVTFLHEGQRYVASRQLKGIKQTDGSVKEQRDVEFVLACTSPDGRSRRIDNPIGTMNAILPVNVRTYFLFDGEKIEHFARPEAADEVRFSVYQVLSLEILSRAQDHLAKVAKDLRSELRGLASGELKSLVTQDEEARQREEGLLKRQKELKDEMAAAQRHIESINQKLRELEAVQAQQKQYDLYTEQMQERQHEFRGLTGRIREMASQGYLVLIEGALTKAKAILDEKRQRGEIPSNIRQQFLQDLLDRKVCICGRSFAEHDEAHHHLNRLMGNSLPTTLENEVLTTSGSLQSLGNRALQLLADLNTAMSEKTRLEDALTRLHAVRDDVERQMKDSQQVEVSDLARQRDTYQMDIDNDHTDQARIELQLEAVKKEIVDLERRIARARKAEDREQLLSRKIELAQQSSDAIGRVYETFAEHKRQQIEAQTREIFHKLAWKGEHFSDVRLTADYQLEVIDRYGLPARPELSAGERQVLSLSFITGMAQVAEREAPLVMDTPFGRLSSAHRERITANMPKLASQLVLFVTDEELRGQALENLKPSIGAEYMLKFDRDTSCTTIEEVRQ